MKKIVACIVVVYFLLFICILQADMPGGHTEQTKDSVTLNVWVHQGITGLPLLLETFEKDFEGRGITVKFHEYDASNSMDNLQLDTNLIAGANVDVYFTHTTQNLSKRIGGGCALDLTALCARDNWDMEERFTSRVRSFYHDGRPFSIPTSVGKMGIILNKDLFDAAGIEIPQSWTFEEFREIAKQLTKPDTYGVYWNTNNNISEALLHMVLSTLGGDPLYKSGGKKTNFDDPVIVEALRLIVNTMYADGSAPTHEDSYSKNLTMKELFLSGQCAMTVGSWLFSEVINDHQYEKDFVTAFAPWPVVEKGRQNYTQGSLGLHLSINPKSPHIDEAWEFVKWYAEKGSGVLISEGYVPSATTYDASFVEEELLKNAGGKIDKESAAALFLNPDENLSIPLISDKIIEITRIFDVAVEDVLIGREEPRAALVRAKAEADGLL